MKNISKTRGKRAVNWCSLAPACLALMQLPIAQPVLAGSGSSGDGNQVLLTPGAPLLSDSPALVAIAWQDNATQVGVVRAARTDAPWTFATPQFQSGDDATLRAAGGRVYVVSQAEGTVTVVDSKTWSVQQVFSLGAASEPLDIAVVSPELAYITRRLASHLLRLDLVTGVTADVVDLSFLADADGVPDLGTMSLHEERLFVQIRRLSSGLPTPPAYIAVVDVATEQLVDVDPATEGMQAIELEGTAPKFKMQVVPESRRLFVNASGAPWDEGGLEVIDLDALETLGLVLREADGQLAVDLINFVMVTPERGFLTVTTDFAPSSHLVPFTLSGGVGEGPDIIVTVDYFTPALAYDPQTDTLFFPDGGSEEPGVYVLDGTTGRLLTPDPIPTSGRPTDLLILPEAGADPAIPTVSDWGSLVTALLLLTAATVVLPHRAEQVEGPKPCCEPRAALRGP